MGKSTSKKKVSKSSSVKPRSSQKRKTSAKKTSQTMEELLKKTGYQLAGLKRGDFIEGRVTDIKKKILLVDIGAKTEGIIVGKDYDEVKDYIAQLKVGDTVLCYIKQPENEHGQIILSLRKAANDWKWNFFEEKLSTDQAIEVRGLRINKGGMISLAHGVQGFIPASQFGKKYQDHLEDLINKLIKVKIIEVDREGNRLIFSEKAVSEARLIAKKRKLLEKVKIGDIFEGKVSGITPFGLFVGIKDLEGLVHISEISWEKVENPEDYFKVKDKVRVKVIDVDQEMGRLNLSVKQLRPDPWEKAKEKYKTGKKMKGKVTSLAPFGAFVNFEPGIDGLLPISKIPVDFNINVGDQVDVEVESLDSENRRMSLSLVLRKKPVGYK
jgi:small subunit ribosomal protein S1